MTETIKEYGNPLLEESRELVSLDNYMVSHTETLDQYEPWAVSKFQKECDNNLFYSTKNKDKPQSSLIQDCT